MGYYLKVESDGLAIAESFSFSKITAGINCCRIFLSQFTVCVYNIVFLFTWATSLSPTFIVGSDSWSESACPPGVLQPLG